MKNLIKTPFFFPSLLLILAIMSVAGLFITTTDYEGRGEQVRSSARQLDSNRDAMPAALLLSNTTDISKTESSELLNRGVSTGAVATSSVRSGMPASPLPSKNSEFNSPETETGIGGRSGPGMVSKVSTPSEVPRTTEGVGFVVGAPQGSELVIPVPPGAKVPALFLDEGQRPLPQQKMLDRMAAEFNEAVSNPPPGVSVEEVWEQARLSADEKYRILFGYVAYNAHHLQAAKEAVREKRALQATAPSTQ
jgi:hypothetical protein